MGPVSESLLMRMSVLRVWTDSISGGKRESGRMACLQVAIVTLRRDVTCVLE